MLRDCRQDVNGYTIGLREVHRYKVHCRH
jgi:hypothetical protein